MVIGHLTVIQWRWMCSHADHECYLDDDWHCHAQTGLGYMMNHEIFAYKTLVSAILYLFWGCCFGNGGSTFLSYDYLELYGANVTYLRKLLSYLLFYMIISLMIAMMRNLFILIALICMVFVFVIVSPAEYQRNELHIFWRNSGK